MGDQNPWLVENIEAFSFYCCPECDFKSKDGDYFERHAMESHNESKIFFIISKYENNTNKDPLEVLTDSLYHDKNEEDMNKFSASVIRVKEESISESEGDFFAKVSEHIHKPQKLNSGPDLETFNDDESADFFERNINTADDQDTEYNNDIQLESEGNKEEAKNFDESTYGITEEKNNIIEGEKKRKRDLDCEREKRKQNLQLKPYTCDQCEVDYFATLFFLISRISVYMCRKSFRQHDFNCRIVCNH